MHAGIDIGTTHISAMVVDVNGKRLISSQSFDNRRIASSYPLMYEQDPVAIEKTVRHIIDTLPGPIDSITLTGQVHGITYYDAQNEAVSGHATWLDRRSEMLYKGRVIEELFQQEYGTRLPAGYAFLTHYANTLLDLVPSRAVGFCGILEYITGRLVGCPLSASEASCLSPMGLFDPVSKSFDRGVVDALLGSSLSTVREPSQPFAIAGMTGEGIPVLYPVGDNQAGFFGLVKEDAGATMVSIGTSGQISYLSDSTEVAEGMELRNLLDAGYIHVGATLTSGKAYENLKSFFESVYTGLTGQSLASEQVFDMMKKAADDDVSQEKITCRPLFAGTRADSTVKGSYGNITLNNFTMAQMVNATVDGIIQELRAFISGESISELVATGSAVRKNHLFRRSMERLFGTEVYVSDIDDGAAFGAALIGAIATGAVPRKDKDAIIELFRSVSK
ncbi:MAG: hypothetical protein JXK93_03375 [Sphaerochaetaceae bacterium]|nr:hypothetical protein [Sphaerochaetaceae bacterium]